MSSAASAHRVKVTADNAYTRQVEGYLGTKTIAGRIEYGAAVATAILPASTWTAGTTSCFLHVTETASAPFSGQGQSGGAGAEGVGTGTGTAAGDGDMDSTSSVSCRIALRDYRAAFRLIGAPYLVDFIDELIDGGPLKTEFEHRFGRLIGPDGPLPWVIGEPGEHSLGDWYYSAQHLPFSTRTFALHERSLDAIIELLGMCGLNRELLDQTVRLPNLSRRMRFDAEEYEADPHRSRLSDQSGSQR
ncbi:hypothetical protein [Mesorhizobium sp. STM 4661]|uniref:hypothetical protein n=1 Tax=Mesorhizobium sp. STM 4661 TaxID=1297570 RepID=UPI0002BDC578|nr:hypothetical protein [Mesorhizobium sp. STM 4661]CCV11618.1 hypothetical protein MESS4_330167 [Mesorhizobium sp. STM 4661]